MYGLLQNNNYVLSETFTKEINTYRTKNVVNLIGENVKHSHLLVENIHRRNPLEILNQKPANYEFAYQVNDGDTESGFGHSESRQLDRVECAYFILLTDGTKQVVEYEADEDGFKPRISVEPVDSETSLGPEGPY